VNPLLNAARTLLHLLRGLLPMLWLALLASQVFAQGLQPVPELTARVMDFTATLNGAQKDALTAKLANFEKAKGTQIVVLMVPTTQPEDIAAYANRVASAWKVGRKGVGDGIVIVVAKNDRRLRIEVARTLEGAVTDLQAKRIIDGAMTPQFKQGNFAEGLSAGVDQLIRLINGEALPEPARQDDSGSLSSIVLWAGWLIVLMGILGAFWIYLALILIFGSGLGVGALVFWLTYSWLWSALACLATYYVTYRLMGRGHVSHASSSGSSTHSGKAIGLEPWEGTYTGGSGWFSSGGGGSFGGGGASGSW
jgi:uncharacterized protein